MQSAFCPAPESRPRSHSDCNKTVSKHSAVTDPSYLVIMDLYFMMPIQGMMMMMTAVTWEPVGSSVTSSLVLLGRRTRERFPNLSAMAVVE